MISYHQKMNISLLKFISKDKIEEEIIRRTDNPNLPYTNIRYYEKSILRNAPIEELRKQL